MECYKIELDSLIDKSKSFPEEAELKDTLTNLNKKLNSLILRTEHQISVTKVLQHFVYFHLNKIIFPLKML